MLIFVNHLHYVSELKIMSGKKFDMKDLRVTKKVLGMKTYMDKNTRKLWLSHKIYVEKVLNKFDMSKSKATSTPLVNQFMLSFNECPKKKYM